MKRLLVVCLSLALIVSNFSIGLQVEAAKVTGSNRLNVVSVTAKSNDGNLPENTIDNISDTRWSAEDTDGSGQWIKYDLGEEEKIGFIGIAFYKGDIRYTNLKIEVSSDDTTYETVYQGHPDEASLDMIKIDIADTTGRYIMITGYGYEYFDGSKVGGWNSLNEVHFYSDDSDTFDEMMVAEVPVAVTYTEPGFVNTDGSQHDIHKPNSLTGASLIATDYASIQEAIDAAVSGDEVFIPAGSYLIKQALILKSGVNLRGNDASDTFLIAQGSDYDDQVIKIYGQDNILVSDLTVTSEFSGSYSTDHKINNPDADGPKYGIRIEDSNGLNLPSYNITIKDVVVEKYQTMGIRIVNSHDVVVDGCTFQNATDLGGGGAGYGVSIQGEGNNINRNGYMNDCRYNLVVNSDFVGPYLRHGVIIQYFAHNNLITNNTFNRTKLDAVDLHGEDEYLNEVSLNHIENIETGAGIGAGNTGATHDKSGPGNYLHNNTIINCREGVKVNLGTENTRIEDNNISASTVSNAKGIYLQNAPGTLVKGNKINNNTSTDFWGLLIEEDPGTEGRGAGVATDIMVSENTFDTCSNGIAITAGLDIVFADNIFTGITGTEFKDTRTQTSTDDKLPSQVLDISDWKLTLPINNAQEIVQPALESYQHNEHFYVNATGDGVVFNAPVQADGTDATTANSKYPRSELREMTNNGLSKASWETDNGKHVMIIDEKITHLPEVKDQVVAGQIHDADDDVIMIRLESNRLFVEAEGTDLGTLNDNYQLDTRFTVKIEAENDVINIYYDDDLKVTYPVHKEGCYFKAGVYTQSNLSKGDAADAYGEVVIYDLGVEHSGITEDTSGDVTEATYDVELPQVVADTSITPSMDTYIELQKVDGVMTPTTSPKSGEDYMRIKTSSGQTTIRLGIVEFDMSTWGDSTYAAAVNFTKKYSKGDSLISVYGTTETFNSDLIWENLFTDSSRISTSNTDVADWLAANAVKIDEVMIYSTPFDTDGNAMYDDPSDLTDYQVNVSSYFHNHEDADHITLILVDEVGENADLKISTSEVAEGPSLDLWASQPISEDDGSFEGVQVGSLPSLWTANGGTWAIVDDNGNKVLQAVESTSTSFLYQADDYTDFTIEADVKTSDTETDAGLLGRYIDSSNYYSLFMDGGKVKLKKKVGGSWTTIDDESMTYDTDTYYHLKLEVSGTSLKAYVDGLLVLEGNDSDLSNGKVGFRTYKNNASYDNFLISIEDSELPADNTENGDSNPSDGNDDSSDKDADGSSTGDVTGDDGSSATPSAQGAEITTIASSDTYIELSSGTASTDGATKAAKDTIYVKTSGGQTTIRMGFLTFDTSIDGDVDAATLRLTTKGTSSKPMDALFSVYANVNEYPDDLIWSDLGLTNASRISKDDNTDIPNWLNDHTTYVGDFNVVQDPNTYGEYTIDVTDFIKANKDAKKITFVLINESGQNSDVYFYSSEKSTEEYRPELMYTLLPAEDEDAADDGIDEDSATDQTSKDDSNNVSSASTTSKKTYYMLTVEDAEGGQVGPFTGTYRLQKGSRIAFTVDPKDGYEFLGWEGAKLEDNILTLSANTTLKPIFGLIIEEEQVPEEGTTSDSESSDIEDVTSNVPNELDILDDTENMDDETLPETGGLPINILLMTGMTALGTGVTLKKRNK